MKKILFLASMVIVSLGCEPFRHHHGFNTEAVDITKIQIGVDTKESLQEKIGSPSSTSLFPDPQTGNTKWFYITKKTSSNAFFSPETLEQRTTVVTFDTQNRVVDIQHVDGEIGININSRKTESTGYESSIMRDIFGNFGRYSQRTPSAQK